MNQTRSNRVRSRRKRRRSKWIRMGQNTLVFSLLAVIAAGLYFAVDSFTKNGRNTDDHASHPATDHVDPPEEPTVALTFVGDVMMSGNVEKRLLEKGFDFPFEHVRSLFLQDDYTIANLETPITLRGTPSENKEFVYKSSPEAIPAMKEAGIDAVNLANNHSMDQGVEGLLDTFSALDAHQIAYVGAGKDAKRAYAPVYVEKKGIRIALLGFSRVIPQVSWYAGKDQPGLAATYDPALAVQAIQEAKKEADLVIVIAHWGKEKVDFPVDYQQALARTYIDAGADLIVGGHPHVLQGFEQYRGKWVAYSMGNFIFTRAVEPKTWDSMVLQANCTKTGDCQLKMLPYYAELGQAVPMNDHDGAALLKRIESISENVQIEGDGTVHAKKE